MLKVLFVYLRKNTFIYSHVLNVYIFTANFENLFVYHLKTTFYVPPRITCCLFLWTTSTYSPFQHIAKDYICHTHCLLIIMAKTHRTNPHSEEPTRRSNRTAGKTPASVELPARKPAATRGERKGPPEGIASKDTAASPSGDSEFSGERKGPPEGIVPAPPPEEATIVPRLPTLWEWTPPSDVSDVAVPPVQPFFRPIVPMPTLVGIDFAAAQHDVIADRDVAAAPRRTSRRYPGSNNNGKYYKMGGGDDNGGKDYDIMVAGEEEGKHDGGGENYDDGYARSVESVDDDRDGDFVPTKGFEYSDDDDDFDHLLDDDDINEEDKRIEKMDSKSRIPTGRRRGNLIQGGPVAPNYKLMSASEASDARIEYQSLRKTYRDGIRRERLRGDKGESFDLKDIDDYMEVRVKRINVPGKREEVVTLPKYPVNGSHFGRCTCGATQTDVVPCEHMSVVALSSIIRPQISPMNIMPIWWKRSQWRLQFPLETCPEAKSKDHDEVGERGTTS